MRYMFHVPVLLQEVLEILDLRPGDFMVDGTVGGGGHAAAILERIGPTGRFLGVDWDSNMVAEEKKQFAIRNPKFAHWNISFFHGNYADLPEILEREGLGKANGLLLDLGFSSEQIARSGRGFSFSEASRSEPLLMAYDDSRMPARDIVKTISEKKLADILFEFGGERYARRIAREIVERRRKKMEL